MIKKLDEFLELFVKNGYQAYGVGGCVRDYLLGRMIHDFDVTTDALPDEIIQLFPNYQLKLIGKKFGTIGIYYHKQWFEVTTFRGEDHYQDNRHPEKVEFKKSLLEDLSRRDFTINALAYYKGNIIDYYNGQKDIRDRIIRCVNDPKIRFSEDALRMIRALRFVSKLGFDIEHETNKAINDLKENILNIPLERISTELIELIEGQYVNKVILEYPELLETLFNQSVFKVEGNSLPIRLFELVKNRSVYSEYALPKLVKKQVQVLNDFGDEIIDKIKLKHIMNQVPHRYLAPLIEYKKIEPIYRTIIDENETYSLKQLKIKGEDLAEFERQKRSVILNHILIEVIEERLSNDREILLEYLNQFK